MEKVNSEKESSDLSRTYLESNKRANCNELLSRVQMLRVIGYIPLTLIRLHSSVVCLLASLSRGISSWSVLLVLSHSINQCYLYTITHLSTLA